MSNIIFTAQTVSNVIPDLPTLKALNMDVVMCYSHAPEYIMSKPETVTYLDALAAAGLKGLLDVTQYTQYGTPGTPDLTELTARVNNVKNHSAMFGYYIADEPTLAQADNTDLQSVHDTIMALDPDHEIVMTLGAGGGGWTNNPAVITQYSRTNHTIQATDYYPVPTNGIWDPTTYANTMAGFLAVIDDDDPCFNIMQIYGGAYDLGVPTAEDLVLFNTATRNSGWARSGHMGYFMWAWDSNATPTMLKENPDLHQTVSQIAAQYTSNASITINGFSAGATPNPVDGVGTFLRVHDSGVTYALNLVDTTDPSASGARFFDGVQTWAVAVATGDPQTITFGALAAIQLAQAQSLAGSLVFSGSGSVTQTLQNQATTGKLVFNGASTTTQQPQTSALSALLSFSGSINQIQQAQQQAIYQALTAITGTVSQTQAAQISALTASLIFGGSAAQTQAVQTQALAAVLRFTGSTAQAQAAQHQAIEAILGAVAITGTVSQSQAIQLATLSASLKFSGSVDQSQAVQRQQLYEFLTSISKIFVNSDGSWIESVAVWVNDAGTWKQGITSARSGGVWQ